MKKRVLAVMMTMALAATALVGCGSDSSSKSDKAEYTIGISQFAEHGSLDNCREGFLEGLKEAGIEEDKNLKVYYDNAQTDTGTAGTIADSYVSKKVDLVCAIATPSAMSAYNSCMKADIPVVYTAVSDPVGAGLVKKDGANAGNVTGSCDLLPVEEQLKMIRAMMPEAKKIGILYTTSEANSVSTIKEYKEKAGEYGFEIVDTGINTIADVDLAASDLVGKVDCICNLTDNTVVQALQTVIEKANAKNIPVFGSEIEQVKAGCVAAMGIDYFELGKKTGAMAAKILKGEATAEETEYIKNADSALYVNTAAADKIGMQLDADYISGAAETFTEITVE
ncbi:MAG: ABC transporter substrate-binding protein [Lachnospiraceae bacterium]|nr:ABC transporter substrate-binding protein [Lachnospiraceae bacterium]MDD7378778.1 ABC transporter substrate-binding protein [Lachnospiraceae bacterium]MDY4618291.1 ABC transporter substrate-binding protein [Lachnospiraceae bacterium]